MLIFESVALAQEAIEGGAVAVFMVEQEHDTDYIVPETKREHLLLRSALLAAAMLSDPSQMAGELEEIIGQHITCAVDAVAVYRDGDWIVAKEELQEGDEGRDTLHACDFLTSDEFFARDNDETSGIVRDEQSGIRLCY